MMIGLFSYPYPFTPPTTAEDELSVLRLIRSRRVGPSTFHKLMSEHGSAQAALTALPDIAKAAGVEDYAVCPEGVVRAELAAGARLGARLLLWGRAGYPSALIETPDAPAALWALGDLRLLERPAVAVVGAREASGLGRRMAGMLARELGAAGYVIASGLARGIDTAAHLAALDTGTIAVQPGGLDVLYPAENSRLAEDIAARGLRLSELPFGTEPRAHHFLARNRIIAGLSQGVVVVEAAARSGSLNAARLAAEMGREVMAVPAHPFEPRAAGCNILIRDGAALVRGTQDILETLKLAGAQPPEAQLPEAPPEPKLRPVAEKPPLPEEDIVDWLLAKLDAEPQSEDLLLRLSPAPKTQLLAVIGQLELEDMIQRTAGGQLMRV